MLRRRVPLKENRRKLKPTGYVYRGYYGQTAIEAVEAWNEVWQTRAYTWEGYIYRINLVPSSLERSFTKSFGL